MFIWDCIKTSGTHLGTCIDKVDFSSCCKLKEWEPIFQKNEIKRDTSSNNERTAIDTSKSYVVPIAPSVIQIKSSIVPIKLFSAVQGSTYRLSLRKLQFVNPVSQDIVSISQQSSKAMLEDSSVPVDTIVITEEQSEFNKMIGTQEKSHSDSTKKGSRFLDTEAGEIQHFIGVTVNTHTKLNTSEMILTKFKSAVSGLEFTTIESIPAVVEYKLADVELESDIDGAELQKDEADETIIKSESAIGESGLLVNRSVSIVKNSAMAIYELGSRTDDFEMIESVTSKSEKFGAEIFDTESSDIKSHIGNPTATPVEVETNETRISDNISVSETIIHEPENYDQETTNTVISASERTTFANIEASYTDFQAIESNTKASVLTGVIPYLMNKMATTLCIDELKLLNLIKTFKNVMDKSGAIHNKSNSGSIINASTPVDVDLMTGEVNKSKNVAGNEEPVNETMILEGSTTTNANIITFPIEVSDEESITGQSLRTSMPLENESVLQILTKNELTTERASVIDNTIKYETTLSHVAEVTVEDKLINKTKEHLIIDPKKPMVGLNFSEVTTATTTSDSIEVTNQSISVGDFDFKAQEKIMVETLKKANYEDICGEPVYPTSRIVGGINASYGEWPWQASLRLGIQVIFKLFGHKCGAAIVNENWVITAAHCVRGVAADQLLVVMGKLNMCTTSHGSYPPVERNIDIIIMHPKFNNISLENDVALLKFSEPIEFQPNIIPICIPNDDYDFINETGVVTGWGQIYENGPLSEVMQKVEVPVIPNEDCEEMYKNAGFIEDIPNIFICAGYQAGKKDSCLGDSGGPLVIRRNNRWRLAGLISWARRCAAENRPGVYTRISQFRKWINKIIVL